MHTGTIKYITDKDVIISTRRYTDRGKMHRTIKLFADTDAFRSGKRFIHIIPDITELDFKTVNKQLMPQVTNEQLEYIKSQRGVLAARLVAKHLDIPVATVYYYNDKLNPVRELVTAKAVKEVKKPLVRPPSIYSNPRLYETM